MFLTYVTKSTFYYRSVVCDCAWGAFHNRWSCVKLVYKQGCRNRGARGSMLLLSLLNCLYNICSIVLICQRLSSYPGSYLHVAVDLLELYPFLADSWSNRDAIVGIQRNFDLSLNYNGWNFKLFFYTISQPI